MTLFLFYFKLQEVVKTTPTCYSETGNTGRNERKEEKTSPAVSDNRKLDFISINAHKIYPYLSCLNLTEKQDLSSWTPFLDCLINS